MEQKKQNDLLRRLGKAIEDDDNEEMHLIYDELIKLRLRVHEPSFIRMLDKLVKDKAFWYA